MLLSKTLQNKDNQRYICNNTTNSLLSLSVKSYEITHTVFGFEVFIEVTVLDTQLKVPQTPANDVIICSYLRSWLPVQWFDPQIIGTTCDFDYKNIKTSQK